MLHRKCMTLVWTIHPLGHITTQYNWLGLPDIRRLSLIKYPLILIWYFICSLVFSVDISDLLTQPAHNGRSLCEWSGKWQVVSHCRSRSQDSDLTQYFVIAALERPAACWLLLRHCMTTLSWSRNTSVTVHCPRLRLRCICAVRKL